MSETTLPRRRRVLGMLGALTLATAGLLGLGSAPAQALGAGDTCMFNAPSGADIGVGAMGHVGWSYLVGGTSTWVYGATESPTYHWHTSGNWNSMLSAFRNAGYGHSAGYYTQFKCTSTPTSAVGAANNAVANGEGSGYNGLTNNCLTKSVAIFNAYYGFGLYGGAYEGPNWYFDHLAWSGPYSL